MTTPTLIAGLGAVAGRYDALLCDAWGVIHNGHALYDGVAEALVRFREERGPVIILTNAPRLSEAIPPQLDRLGLPRAAYDTVVTSGDATCDAVNRRTDLDFYRLGPDKDETLYAALDRPFVGFDEATAILCTGPEDDMHETPEDYRDMLTTAAARGMPMVCANPDKVVKLGDRLIYCAGALGDLYEELGGQVILCGKPHGPIYDAAMAVLAGKGITDPSRILAIGDGLQTDILGANRQGLDVAFVAEGIFSREARDDTGHLDAARLGALLRQYEVTATFAMDGLVW